MKEITFLKEVEEITKIAKNIFGDFVLKAYVVDSLYTLAYEQQVDSVKNSIEKQLKNIITNSSENSIDQDGKNIIIEFTNGKKVLFHNSEWGSMTSFISNEEDVYL